MYELRTLGRLDLRAADGHSLTSLLSLPKRSAILCYLAVAVPHGFHRRERIASVFWPESDTQRARQSLRQALHGIRTSLGEDALLVVGDEEVALNTAHVWCDAHELDRAFEERRWEDVVELHRGPLLDGFHLDNSPEFENWADEQRRRLQGRAEAAVWKCVDAAVARQDRDAALVWGQRALELAVTDEAALRRYLQLAASFGDHMAAVQAYDRFVARMRRDYELEPSAATVSLAQELRQATTSPPLPPLVPPAPVVSDLMVATPPRDPVATPVPAPSSSSVSRAFRVTAATAAVLLLSALLAVAFRRAKPVPPEYGSVVLAEIRPAGVHPALAGAVTELLRSRLLQSSEFRPLTRQEVSDALFRMQRPGPAVDDTTAVTIALREGVKATLGGELRRVGEKYVLLVRLVSAADGRVLLAGQQVSRDTADLIAAAQRLARRLNPEINERLQSVPSPEPLARVTTGSLAALRNYTKALRTSADGGDPLAFLDAALAADSGFNSGWREWARRNAEDDYLSPKVLDAIGRAYRTRGRLPEVERLCVEAEYYWMHYRPDRAADRWRAVLALDSTSTTALLGLGAATVSQRQFAAAESALSRVLATSPRHLRALSLLVDARVGQGRLASGDSLIARYRPPQAAWVISKLLTAKRDYRAVLAHWDSVAKSRGRASPPEGAAMPVDVWSRFMLGRHREARELLSGNPNIARMQARLRYGKSDTAAVARTLDEYLAARGLDTVHYYVINLIPLLAELGRVSQARRMLDQWARTIPDSPYLLENRARDQGAIALAEGRLLDAARWYLQYHANPLVSNDHWYNRGLPEAAAIFERLGRPDTAIVLYERAIAEPPWHMYPMMWESLWYPFTLQHLGELHELRGDTTKAVQYYSRFIDLWRDADPELQPQVRAARGAVERLRHRE